MKISVLMPTYNGAQTLEASLRSLNRAVSGLDYEIVVSDDCSTDETVNILCRFADERVKVYVNDENLGYPGNLRKLRHLATGDVLVLFAQDDFISQGYLREVVDILRENPQVLAVTRPYYAFAHDYRRPTRFKKRLGEDGSITILDVGSPRADLLTVFRTLDQLSGLAFRSSSFKVDFNDDVFPCHVYPFADMLERGSIAMTGTYSIAVRTESSQCRHVSWIYDVSPVQSWINLFKEVLAKPEHASLQRFFISEFCANNSVGLLQIRNYSRRPFAYLWREIRIMVKSRPKLMINPIFLGVVVTCVIVPRPILRRLVDGFKSYVSSKTVPGYVTRHIHEDY